MDMEYPILVKSNILLLIGVQQQVVILEFSQEKMSACPSMPPFWDNLENSAVVTGLEKVSFILIPKKCNAKKCSNDDTIALISQASKVMLKVLQARLQQYVNCEFPDVYVEFRKVRETREIANICWITDKARVPEKYLLLLC